MKPWKGWGTHSVKVREKRRLKFVVSHPFHDETVERMGTHSVKVFVKKDG